MTNHSERLLLEFAYKLPVAAESLQVPPIQGGIYAYQATLLTGSPVIFDGPASCRATDGSGNDVYIPFQCLYGTPTAVVQASRAQLESLFQEMLRR